MPDTKVTMKVGDWIRITPLWPGIWKISRVLADFKESRWSLSEPSVISPRTLVFCHRIANDLWKRSFSFQCCEISYVIPLGPEDLQQLQSCLLSDSKLLKAFEKYQSTTKSIDLVANLAFGGLSEQNFMQFQGLCDEMLAGRIHEGVTLDEVLMLLQAHGLDSQMRVFPLQVTLQLISTNHELRCDEFVYRRYRALNR